VKRHLLGGSKSAVPRGGPHGESNRSRMRKAKVKRRMRLRLGFAFLSTHLKFEIFEARFGGSGEFASIGDLSHGLYALLLQTIGSGELTKGSAAAAQGPPRFLTRLGNGMAGGLAIHVCWMPQPTETLLDLILHDRFTVRFEHGQREM